MDRITENGIVYNEDKTIIYEVHNTKGTLVVPETVELIKTGAIAEDDKTNAIDSILLLGTNTTVEEDFMIITFECPNYIDKIVWQGPDKQHTFYMPELKWDRRYIMQNKFLSGPAGAVCNLEKLDSMFGVESDRGKFGVAFCRWIGDYDLDPALERKYRAYVKKNIYRAMEKLLADSNIEAIERLNKEDMLEASVVDYFLQDNSINAEAKMILLEIQGKNSSDDLMDMLSLDLEEAPMSIEDLKMIWEWTDEQDGSVTIHSYTGHDPDVVIPATLAGKPVKSIGVHAFSPWKRGRTVQSKEFLKTLRSVEISEGIENIEMEAFRNCNKLEKVIIPDSMKTIGGRAFNWCRKLKSIEIPEGVEKISQGLGIVDLEMTEVIYRKK